MPEIKLESPPEAHYTVYKLTDPEGKLYIGLTGKPAEQRWRKGRGYSRDTPIRAAVNRYGWEAFEKTILCEKLTKAGAEMSEVSKKICRNVKNRQYAERPELIEKIRSSVNTAYANDPVYRERIGKKVLEAYERDPTLKTRISNTVRQLWTDPEYRYRATEGRAAVCSGNTKAAAEMQVKGRQYYREHPERKAEVSAQMSAYLLSPEGRKFVESDSRPKPVRCVETGKIYPSQRAAERETGFCNIHKVCSGRNRVCGGYHWEYI